MAASTYDAKTSGATAGLARAIFAALRAAGKDPLRPTLDDLAPLDEFHVRGRQATLELAAIAGIGPATRVLDVGSGLGGPSRRLAATFGCRVTGIDLCEDYCAVAALLAQRTGLSDRVRYCCSDALALPFADRSFDIVWTQHAAMTIADKPRLYRELSRVLVPHGVLAIYDVVAGRVQPAHYPTPWARTGDESFLVAPPALRDLLTAAGFVVERFDDTTAAGCEAFARFVETIGQRGPPPLGLQIVLGPAFETMARNQARNLAEGRIALAQIVARRR
jgi:ubiquinone/menaquinone biosynthesis C-methylase UbiE